MTTATTAPVSPGLEINPELLAQLLTTDAFTPQEPATIAETGLSLQFIEALLCKHLAVLGGNSGNRLANGVCLPFRLVASILESMRGRQLVTHSGTAPLNDYNYVLTEAGLTRARSCLQQCAYVGPAPVPLPEYIVSVEAQAIGDEAPSRQTLRDACQGISVEPKLFEQLGPALNSCAGMFLYGAPGNGKSTLARCLTSCFGQSIWIPHAIIENGEIIKFFDTQFHKVIEGVEATALRSASIDRRWVRIERPTVVVGGELTMDNLELRHHPESNVIEAPLQMKSNCGCLLIDDFGRQRIAPAELLNRWIVPLESRLDFLTLPSGRKIQVPFEQLIIFSTNLEPEDLVDEAFLRRIPYKISMNDPSDEEFHHLFRLYCDKLGCEYRKDVVNHLFDKHYRQVGRAKRRCHARDLLLQVRNYCRYHGHLFELRPEYLDSVVETYFAMVLKAKSVS
ncbi:MAG: AAA family ATPase [Planctomycetaceae bacterium]|nr:AAA family ATPase [Planctomycetaceae bacterium]